MFLQQRGTLKQQQREQQLKSVNLDISILNGLTKQTTLQKDLSTKNKPSKLSLNELSSVLKNKNQKFEGFKDEKQQAIEWLKFKGVDWRKLNLEISENARVAQQVVIPRDKRVQFRGVDASTIPRETISRVSQAERQYGFTAEIQQDFIQRQKQVTLCKTILKSLKSTKPKNNTRMALLNKMKGEKATREMSFDLNQELLGGQTQRKAEQSYKRRDQYFNFVERLSTGGFDQSLQLLKTIRPFWKIVLQHVKTVQHYAPKLQHLKNMRNYPNQQQEISEIQLRMNSFLMLKSLKIVEQQFDKSLPSSAQSFSKLDELIRGAQSHSRTLRVWRNYNGEPTWALAFMLLKSGRMTELKRVLQNVDRQLLQQLIHYQESIDKQQPQPSMKRHDLAKYNDNFYRQIIHVLEGKAKFDPEVILGSEMTKIWLILRTMGIYRNMREINVQYGKLMEQVIGRQTASSHGVTEQKVGEFLLLGDYKHFLHMIQLIEDNKIDKEHDEFSYDDYFHLLTVVNYFSELWGNNSEREKLQLQAKYADVLLDFMRRLRNEGYNHEIPSYLLLTPPSLIQRIACEFITTPQQYQHFDWKLFNKLLLTRNPDNAQQIYRELQRKVLNQLNLITFADFAFASEMYRSAKYLPEEALYREHKCYVQLLLTYTYFKEKKKILLNRNQLTDDFEKQMFYFFGLSKEENPVKLSQKDREIRLKVQNYEDRLQGEIVKVSHGQEHSKNVIIPFDFYKSIVNMSKLLQNPLQMIADLKKFKPQLNEEINDQRERQLSTIPTRTHHLLRFLKFEFAQQMVELYIYYKLQLIERKKIVSSIDCDYLGLTNYVRSIGQQLKQLESYYQQKSDQVGKRGLRLTNEEEKRLNEETTNPLAGCKQYHRLKSMINQHLQALVEENPQIQGQQQKPFQSQRPERVRINERARFSFA